ncbi:MAG: anhydro-N-acetylmuramic acid kinase [Aestuariibacter sp.]
MSDYYIGLISGTSMDGVDAVIAELSSTTCKTIDFLSLPYDTELLNELRALCQPGDDEINRSAKADRQVAMHFARAIEILLKQNQLCSKDIRLVGSHGQTIRHHPDIEPGYSVQIGDPNSIATLSNIDVVADFRRKDIALGGQGAPLVPAFHHAVFQSNQEHRVILNIGGIANISYLPKDADKDSLLGFDTGPGNRLLDTWCKQHTGENYDKNGDWARSGTVNEALLAGLLSLDYFSAPAPKSTGREQFHLEWLNQVLQVQSEKIAPQDVQATLLQVTVQSITQQINQLPAVDSVYVCGGGVHNQLMMTELAKALPSKNLLSTTQLGIEPDAVEALAFAWLAFAFQHNIPGNVPSVTGAKRSAVLGVLSKSA